MIENHLVIHLYIVALLVLCNTTLSPSITSIFPWPKYVGLCMRKLLFIGKLSSVSHDFPKPQVLMVFLFKLTMIYLFLVILMSIGLVALITSTILVGTTLFLVLISFHGHFQSRRLCLTPITNLNIGDSLINVVAKVTWIESVLRELRVSLPQPPILLCDNISATHLDKPCWNTLSFYPWKAYASHTQNSIHLFYRPTSQCYDQSSSFISLVQSSVQADCSSQTTQLEGRC